MSDGEQRPLTPKDGCEECQRLRDSVESARQAKSHLMYGAMPGYRSDQSRSKQYKGVRDQMSSTKECRTLTTKRPLKTGLPIGTGLGHLAHWK
jgi:hypothetical protein